jgi:hypothetical protein
VRLLGLWIWAWAWAAPRPHVVDLPADLPAGEAYDLLLERAVAHPDVRAGGEIQVRMGDGRVLPLRTLQPTGDAPVKEGPRLQAMPSVHPSRADGGLTGKAVYVSQCHGWMYFDSLGRFSTQRGVLFDTVEDFHNPEGANSYLVPYLENAGAMVYTARERDENPQMVIVDDGDPDYSEDGRTFEGDGRGFGEVGRIDYGVNPFEEGSSRRLRADSGDIARWTPQVPEDGVYAVYVTWQDAGDRATDAHYRLIHPGGVIDRRFDQTVHGGTWQYVETLYLTRGRSLTVELHADSVEGGDWLSADAVRIGGGRASVAREGQVPAVDRWEVSAISYTQFNGAPVSVYDAQGNGIGTDHVARSKWADWEHPAGEDAVYVSWHSNAGSGSLRGTVTYFAGGGEDAPPSLPRACSGRDAITGSYTLARTLQDELYAALRALQTPDWRHAYGQEGLDTACFSEISPELQNEMPSALVELGFHDNELDTAFLKDPSFRRDAARAMYRAIVRYFAERDGLEPRFLPEPPVELAFVHGEDGRLALSWSAGPSGAPYGDAAESYLVEGSADGKVWSHRFAVTSTSTPIALVDGAVRYVRVSAVNEGGLSFPSEVIGARQSPDGSAPALVVSGFDRLDAFQLNRRTPPNLDEVVRMDLRRMNAFDTAVAHGQALTEAGWPFDTISDERLGEVELGAYRLIWWVAGEESGGTTTFTPAQQQLLRAFVEQGGALWVTGSEVLWDLDFLGSGADKAFAEEVLGASMGADSSGTYAVSGTGPLAGVGALDFGLADGAPYPVEYADVLDSDRTPLARYAGGGLAAVHGDGVALFGFPFEAIGDPSVRAEVARRMLALLVPDYEPPSWEDGDTGVWVGEAPGAPPGPVSGRRVRLADLGGCRCAVGGSNGGGGPAMVGCLLGLLGARTRRARVPAPSTPTAVSTPRRCSDGNLV